VVQLKDVFDGRVLAAGASVCEDVGADLRQRDLKMHDVAVVLVTATGLT
jgi:hypothetical protein